MKKLYLPMALLSLTACTSMISPAKLHDPSIDSYSELSGLAWNNFAQEEGLVGVQVVAVNNMGVPFYSPHAIVNPGKTNIKVDCFKDYSPVGVTLDGTVTAKGEGTFMLEKGVKYTLQAKRVSGNYFTCEPVIYKTSALTN